MIQTQLTDSGLYALNRLFHFLENPTEAWRVTHLPAHNNRYLVKLERQKFSQDRL